MNDLPDLSHLASLYAIDALDEAERARFETYLARHPEARAEVAEFRNTVARVAQASAEPAPPGLRARVLDTIATTPQLRLAGPAERPIGQPPARPRRWVARGLAAAAAAALVVGAIASLRWRDQRDDLGAVNAVLGAPDAVAVALAPGDGSGRAAGRVTWSPSIGRTVITASDLTAAAGRDFQLWLIDDGTPRSIALVDGEATAIEELVESTPGPGDAFGITVEPDGGSSQPTGELVLVSDPVS